jgi:hypothetical protein
MSPSESASAPTSTAAILSLVFGILGWVGLPVLGSIVAIVCGHMARAEIRKAGVALQGDGLAIAGLVLGWAQLAMTALLVLAMVLFFGGLAAFLVAAGVAGG